ncbi:MAG TPA: DUF5677 domain-containing protein [Chitinophagaceae bacterium]|nr:DUF5677 domain-containing protein [Chitinophagaceae bacterium]
MQETYTLEQIKGYCSLIDEIVEKSEWVIEKAFEIEVDHSFEIAALLSIREIADYADGVSILINHQSNDSTIPIIRSMFELSAGLEYLLQEDFDNRAKKLLYFYYKMKEAELLKIKKGKIENEKFIKNIKEDKNMDEETLLEMQLEQNIDDKLEAVQKIIHGEVYSDLEQYYNKAREEKKRYWYSLLDGPTSFKKLIESLNMHSRYHISYNLWSGYSHGWDIVNRNLVFEEEERVRIVAKRNPTGSSQNALESIMILRRSLMKYVKTRLEKKAKEFAVWLLGFNKRMEVIFEFKK